MSPKIAFIGNSHLAAFKTGWKQLLSSERTFEPTFFGAVKNTLKTLRFDDDILRSSDPEVRASLLRTSGGLDAIPTADFDFFVLVALGLGPGRQLRLLETHVPLSLDDAMPGAPQRVSDTFFARVITDNASRSTAIRLARGIHRVSGKPVYVFPQPMPSTAILGDRLQRQWSFWQQLASPRVRAWAREQQLAVGAAVSTKAIIVMDQPAHTLEGQLTAARFCESSVRLTGDLDRPHAEDDSFHMNAAFGAACLADLSRRLVTNPISAAPA